MELGNKAMQTTAGNLSLDSMSMSDRIDASTAKAFYSNSSSYIGSYGGWWPYNNFTIREVRAGFEEAFKIVSMMIEKGYLKNIRLKDFIRIVKEVESEL